MVESVGGVRWAWRCAAPSCDAREAQPLRTENDARRPADEHSRETGHPVAWGIVRGRGLH